MGPLGAPLGFEWQIGASRTRSVARVNSVPHPASQSRPEEALYTGLGKIFKRSATSSTVRREEDIGQFSSLGDNLDGVYIGHCVLFVNIKEIICPPFKKNEQTWEDK